MSHSRANLLSSIFYFVSPFTLWILFCLIVFIIDKQTFHGNTETWTHQLASLFFPSFFILGPMIIFVRFLARNNLSRIWIIESTMMTCLAAGFYFFFR